MRKIKLDNRNLDAFPWSAFPYDPTNPHPEELDANSNNSKLELLKEIDQIDLSRNKLGGIPREISLFISLVDLALSHNSIKEFPMGICDLVKLQRLNLSFNFIESLPQDLSRLTDLEEELSSLPKLEMLTLESNPHGPLPKALLLDTKVFIVSGMDGAQEIIPGLFLGGVGTEMRKNILDSFGVTNILSADSTTPSHPESFEYLHVDVPDTDKGDILTVLPQSLKFIDKTFKQGGKIFVHCNCGISRSGSIVIAYLMKSRSMSFEEALVYVRGIRPCVRPNRAFVRQLRSLETSKFFDNLKFD